jgi:SulP family sulfate permease
VKTALAGLLPPLTWLRGYDRAALASDALAAVIVTIMLIPQSLAYALLAGLPAEMGLYASILPLAAYALFGSSRTLSVGPVAVVSLMTATAVGSIAAEGTLGYATAAIAMALLSGMMLIGMGLLRFGYLANLLSHPVVSGFITASGIIIALSQLRHILGISGHGETLPTLLASLAAHLGDSNGVTLVTGLAALAFLFWVRSGLAPLPASCRPVGTVRGHVGEGGSRAGHHRDYRGQRCPGLRGARRGPGRSGTQRTARFRPAAD